MPRIARKYLESSYVHIIVQGINREYIFEEDSFKEAYKYLIKKNSNETKTNILAYCIMDNHAHLLVYNTNVIDIKRMMQKSNTSYAKLYNKTKKRIGYVFRDRYYSQAILSEKQLFNCMVYIHNNPVKANICNSMSKYLYSSYNEYLYNKDLITKESIKLLFGSEKNYIEMFNEIHKREGIEDIIEIRDNIKDSNQIIDEFLEKYNKKIEEIINDDEMFGKLLIELRHIGQLSLREMSKIFKINKNKINKIINKNL